MTEEALIEGCKHNDRISQQRLYLQVYPALYDLCRRFFDDEQEIVTAINNGMLRVFKNIAQYNPAHAQLLTWVYAIVRNETLTLVRNKKNVVETRELTADLAAEMVSNPFDKSSAEEILVYLQKLPGSTRTVFNLFYVEAYSIRDISEALDMKEGTVKWHLSDGRNKIRSLFQPKGALNGKWKSPVIL